MILHGKRLQTIAMTTHSKMFKVENSASKAELERSGQEVLLMELENDIAVLLEEKEMELEGRGEENYIREI